MEVPIYIGLSRQVALRRQLEVIGNNIANLNTAGFRAERTLFESALESAGSVKGDRAAFTIDRETYTDHQTGSFATTGNPFDVALDGEGWLQVQTPDGVRYTRDGRMRRDTEGQLVNAAGQPYLDDGGQPIVVPAESSEFAVNRDGTVSADQQSVAKLGIMRFADRRALSQTGDTQFKAADGVVPEEDTETRVSQGKIEESNVKGVLEMTRMMDLSRDYQAVTRMVEDGQELLRSAINRLGKSS
jgi:flagellar basal-body rod protein FlgF